MNKIFKVGLIGCGHISETYFRAQEYFNNIRIVKCADINMDAAKKCAIHYNIEAVTVEEILNDKEIEIILNLTIPAAHFEVSKMALENGKHSYAEKPLSVDFDDGKKLIEIASNKNLYLGNAPDTFLGEGIQKTRELIDNGVMEISS
jgi:Predicted dehydrogenases and related proteins